MATGDRLDCMGAGKKIGALHSYHMTDVHTVLSLAPISALTNLKIPSCLISACGWGAEEPFRADAANTFAQTRQCINHGR